MAAAFNKSRSNRPDGWAAPNARVQTRTGDAGPGAVDGAMPGEMPGDDAGPWAAAGEAHQHASNGSGQHLGQPPVTRLRDPESTKSERTYATFMHLSLILSFAIPIVVPALIMWVIRREDSPFLDDHGREVVNFQISLFIYYAASAILAATIIGLVVAIPAVPLIYLLGLIGMLRGMAAAGRGEFFRAPMTLRLIPDPVVE